MTLREATAALACAICEDCRVSNPTRDEAGNRAHGAVPCEADLIWTAFELAIKEVPLKGDTR